MAGSVERSQAYLRDLSELPPAHQGPAHPPDRRPDLFSSALRQASRKRVTLLEQLFAGEFHVRLAVLLGGTMLAVVLITVLT